MTIMGKMLGSKMSKVISEQDVSKTVTPICIVGYMHSGTTLLFNVLRGHASIYTAAPETKFFEVLPRLKRRFVDLGDIEVTNGRGN